MTADVAAEAVSAVAENLGWKAIRHPLADGGEGTKECIASHFTEIWLDSADALSRPQKASYLLDSEGNAAITAADFIGLEQLALADRNPMITTSASLADPLLDALSRGAKSITLFVGGVATVDGGIGMLGALGANTDLNDFDLTPAIQKFAGVTLTVATDVSSPLTGPDGAAYLFGPQKGAAPEQVTQLEAALTVIGVKLGIDPNTPGAGAAGGLGAAFMALGASRKSGAEEVLRLTRFAEELQGASLCITGEGKVDRGSAHGKTVSAVLEACRAAGVPCVVLGGTIAGEDTADQLRELGALDVRSITPDGQPLSEALANGAKNLAATTYELLSQM